ncbi:MAG: SatD family protein [Acidobacteriaceae bacterium]
MARKSTGTHYAVITADVVGSRKLESFGKKRDRRLTAVSRLHLSQKLILSPYTVTAWDEFQAILRKPEDVSRVILDLRRFFYPLQLRIAVGIGSVSEVHKRPINRYAGGEAFERARTAADRMKRASPKYRLFTSFESGNEIFDAIANTIYRLQDALLERTTTRQWATINTQLKTDRQDATARRLALDVSTVSRNLKRGYYWHLIETAEAMEKIVQAYF